MSSMKRIVPILLVVAALGATLQPAAAATVAPKLQGPYLQWGYRAAVQPTGCAGLETDMLTSFNDPQNASHLATWIVDVTWCADWRTREVHFAGGLGAAYGSHGDTLLVHPSASNTGPVWFRPKTASWRWIPWYGGHAFTYTASTTAYWCSNMQCPPVHLTVHALLSWTGRYAYYAVVS
jgi:hypothetical protein